MPVPTQSPGQPDLGSLLLWLRFFCEGYGSTMPGPFCATVQAQLQNEAEELQDGNPKLCPTGLLQMRCVFLTQ